MGSLPEYPGLTTAQITTDEADEKDIAVDDEPEIGEELGLYQKV